MTHDVVRLWAHAMLNAWSVALTLLGVVVVIGGSFAGVPSGSPLATALGRLDIYRVYFALLLFLVALFAATIRMAKGLEHDFYKHSAAARADRAHRVFRGLVHDWYALWRVAPEYREARLSQFDGAVQAALRDHCMPVEAERYFIHTRHQDPKRGDIPLSWESLSDAHEFLTRLLRDFEREPGTRLLR